MIDQAFAAALDRLQNGSVELRDRARTILPKIEDALRSEEEHPGEAATRKAFALERLEDLTEPAEQVVQALDHLLRALGGQPLLRTDEDRAGNSGREQRLAINFKALTKLREPLILEKALEVYATLRGEKEPVLLRLEAMRPPQGGGYEVAVSREDSVLVRPDTIKDGVLAEKPRSARLWLHYDTIHSDLPSADLALQQVLGFLNMRCA